MVYRKMVSINESTVFLDQLRTNILKSESLELLVSLAGDYIPEEVLGKIKAEGNSFWFQEKKLKKNQNIISAFKEDERIFHTFQVLLGSNIIPGFPVNNVCGNEFQLSLTRKEYETVVKLKNLGIDSNDYGLSAGIFRDHYTELDNLKQNILEFYGFEIEESSDNEITHVAISDNFNCEMDEDDEIIILIRIEDALYSGVVNCNILRFVNNSKDKLVVDRNRIDETVQLVASEFERFRCMPLKSYRRNNKDYYEILDTEVDLASLLKRLA